MRVAFYYSNDKGELPLIHTLSQGIRRHGDTNVTVLALQDFDAGQIAGVDTVFVARTLRLTKTVMDTCRDEGINFVYYDKGYIHRGWKTINTRVYYRFSINNFQPLDYFQRIPRPPDRWEELNCKLRPRQSGKHIIFAGYSHKFADFYDIPLTEYAAHATNIIQVLQGLTQKPIIYRARVTQTDYSSPIHNTTLSYGRRKIREELREAHALVTFSSNAAVDALMEGVPVFVLGPGIARPLSNPSLETLERPFFPSDKERFQFFCDLAYCQWRMDEMENGEVWEHLKSVLYGSYVF